MGLVVWDGAQYHPSTVSGELGGVPVHSLALGSLPPHVAFGVAGRDSLTCNLCLRWHPLCGPTARLLGPGVWR